MELVRRAGIGLVAAVAQTAGGEMDADRRGTHPLREDGYQCDDAVCPWVDVSQTKQAPSGLFEPATTYRRDSLK